MHTLKKLFILDREEEGNGKKKRERERELEVKRVLVKRRHFIAKKKQIFLLVCTFIHIYH